MSYLLIRTLGTRSLPSLPCHRLHRARVYLDVKPIGVAACRPGLVSRMSRNLRAAVVRNGLIASFGFTVPSLQISAQVSEDTEVGSEILTYGTALERALTQSLERKRAALAHEQALLTRDLIRYEDDPEVALQASWAQRYKETAPVRGTAPEKIAREQSYGIALQIPLYDFGRLDARERQLDAAAKAKSLVLAELDEALHFAVARSYLNAVAAEHLQRIAHDQSQLSAQKAREHIRDYQQGLRPESDVVTAELDLAKAETNLARAREATHTARMQLAHLMGHDDHSVKTPAFTLPEGNLTLPPPEEWLQRAAQWRAKAEMAADARREAEREGLVAALDGLDAERRPQLGASFGVQEVGSWQPIKPAASGQLVLSWDIPWNGQLREQQDELMLKRRDIDLAAEADQRARYQRSALAKSALSQGQKLWQMLERQLTLALKQQRLIKARYEAGKASAIDLSNSEAGVLAARLDQVKLAQESALAALALAEAQGVLKLGAPFQ